jgi:hypothetical protein
MNRELHSLLALTYIATLTVNYSSETCRMSNFYCFFFLRSTGFDSYLTFTKSLSIKHCQQNILNYSETMVSRKMNYNSNCMMTFITEHNVYTNNGNIFSSCRRNTSERYILWCRHTILTECSYRNYVTRQNSYQFFLQPTAWLTTLFPSILKNGKFNLRHINRCRD